MDTNAPTTGFVGFVLGTGPTSNNLMTVKRLSIAARSLGYGVRIFLFDDGIHAAQISYSAKSPLADFQALADAGVTIFVCSNMAKFRGLGQENIHPKIVVGSLLEFTRMVVECNALVSFCF